MAAALMQLRWTEEAANDLEGIADIRTEPIQTSALRGAFLGRMCL
jgi:hypothetical protein